MSIVETRIITGGVDTHLDVHVAAALEANGGALGVESFPTTTTDSPPPNEAEHAHDMPFFAGRDDGDADIRCRECVRERLQPSLMLRAETSRGERGSRVRTEPNLMPAVRVGLVVGDDDEAGWSAWYGPTDASA